MRKFKVGQVYKFNQPTQDAEIWERHSFYKDLDSAYEQAGNNAYFPENGKAVVTFLGLEYVGDEPYNKWLHEGKEVFINFADDCFREQKNKNA